MGAVRCGPTNPPIRRSLRFRNRKRARVEYNSRGKKTRYTDPVGRETLYDYNEQDLVKIKQKNGPNYDLLRDITYNSAHKPLTITDADGQTTTYTYNDQGQLLTISTPARAGINENRTKTYDYGEDGYLESVTGPGTGATTSYTYDSYGRVGTVADSDGYVLTYDYDALDRQTKGTYPDSTYDETVYERLDAVRTRDRLGKWSQRFYDRLGRVIATTDPLGRTVTQQWCGCGSLDAIIDANGNTTNWERDVQGRVTKQIQANGSEWEYMYESTISRLKTVTDPKAQVKTFGYFVDDNPSGVTYTNEQYTTPDVSFTYESAFNRMATMVDGAGTTTYSYHSIGASPDLGAGRLASVDGPLADDTISYTYDELGRVVRRAIDGATLSQEHDAFGRIITENNVLGSFSYQYDGATSRLKAMTYPHGQTSSFTYYPNSGDNRLHEIFHKKSGGTTLSKFNYTYDVVGNIQTWTQQQDTDPAKAYDFEYDRADELRNAVWRTTDETPTILKRYGYTYDLSGNRTVEQIDNAPVLSAYDNMNRLSSQSPGGTMRFAGTLNEAATVTIQGAPATVTSDDRFAGGAQVGSGTTQVVVKAKDYSGNERTNTYEVSVSGNSKTFTFDANGNMTGDGTRSFEWDAENRLTAVVMGVYRSEFSYNGHTQRVRRIEKENDNVTSDYRYLWCDTEICQERDTATSEISGQFFSQGFASDGDFFYYTRDHLGSIRELLDVSEAVRARYAYDIYGSATKLSGDIDSPLQFTGHYFHADSGLLLTYYRAYDTATGRWLSEDPAGRDRLGNLYTYARNDPVSFMDPYGLVEVDRTYVKVRRAVDIDGMCANDSAPAGACFRPDNPYGAFVTHTCKCDTLAFTLKPFGTIFVYSGPFPYKNRTPKDKSVTDAASAIAHEWATHIEPAIAEAKSILEPYERQYESTKECHDAADEAIGLALPAFKRVLDETQENENR
jgi:RHS repeat-associated protein